MTSNEVGCFRGASWLRGLAVCLALGVAGTCGPPAWADAGAFRDGDRWCVVGDSITHNGRYHDWVWLFHLTRFPERALQASNCGISGDTAAGGLQRLGWDVMTRNPTVTSVLFGMNDVDRSLYGDGLMTPRIAEERIARVAAYETNLRDIVETLARSGSRVILMTPTIFDQTAVLPTPKQPGVDDALATCANFVRQLAQETGSGLVDFHAEMGRINREQQALEPRFSIVGTDRVHPGAPGQMVMTYLFLKAQRAPALVSRLAIDLRANRIVAAENGTLENVRREVDGGVVFTWASRALPFPVDPTAEEALKWVPLIQELNQEVVAIAGLSPGSYELRIDDHVIRTYSATELAAGINLARESRTPQHAQAMDVLRLVSARAELVADSIRTIAQVEHEVAPTAPRPIGGDSFQVMLQSGLDALRDRPEGDATRRLFELYSIRKEREREAISAADRLARLARLTAQPRPHLYAIRPVR